jgi:hypothetical protein
MSHRLSKEEQRFIDKAFDDLLSPGLTDRYQHIDPQKDNMEYTEEEIEIAFEYFTSEAQRIVSNYMDTTFPTLPKETIEVDEGRVYWKLMRASNPGLHGLSNSRSVHAFVRKKDGAIFRPASCKAPYTKGKSAIRGYVTDDWASSVLTPHGVAYAK